MLLRLMTCLILTLACTTAARADFGDCTDPDYLGMMQDSALLLDLECVEVYRVPAPNPGGPVEIRGIMDLRAGWTVTDPFITASRQGAEFAAQAMPQLGAYKFNDTTIFLLDDAFDLTVDPRDDGEVAAETVTKPYIRPDGTPECLVALYHLLGGLTAIELQTTTAHELFHCIQNASLQGGQTDTYDAGGDWWTEGTAVLFSAIAVPGSYPITDLGPAFSASVRDEVPLYKMAHEASTFFMWWSETRGLPNIMSFMRAMATSNGDQAQRAAMRNVLGDDEWLEFAQSYADADIRHPQGGQIAALPEESEIINITAPGTQNLTLLPFTVLIVRLEYDCGLWGHRFSDSNANLSISSEPFVWQDWDEEIDAREGNPTSYRLVAMHTGDAPLDLEIEIERRASCAPCVNEEDRVDACLMGTWQATGGGPVEWMKAQGLPITRIADSPRYVTFRSDGMYGAEPVGVEIELREEDMLSVGEGYVTAAFGNWSVDPDAGTLNICQQAGQLAGRVTVTHDGTTVRVPVAQPGAAEITMRYNCSKGGKLDTYMDIPGMPQMVTNYTLLSPEIPPTAD